MKYFTKFLFVILLLLTGRYTFSQSWYQLNSGLTSNLTYIHFLDGNTGFAGPSFIRTTDGGNSWVQISTPAAFTDVCFLDINNGYATSGTPYNGGYLYKTTNGGVNWANIFNYMHVGSIYFTDINTGYFLYNQGVQDVMITKTTNGGLTWGNDYQLYYCGVCQGSLYTGKINFVSPGQGYLIFTLNLFGGPPPPDGIYSYIEKTTDGGNSWMPMLNSYNNISYVDFSFPSAGSGFCVGNSQSGSGFILQYNGQISYSTTTRFLGISSPSSSIAFAVGESGMIRKTSNEGTNWYSQNSNVTSNLNQVLFINTQTGYIVGDSGKILKTINGGDPYHTISGQIRFQDNNQPVNNGFVKALKYDRGSNQILTTDSTSIQSNGTYSLIHVPCDSIYIMAFENDEAQLVFVPTYYPSTTNWQNATVLYPTGNLTNIDVLVYRINNTGGPYHIGGHIFSNSLTPLNGLKNAIVYAKSGSDYKSYSISNASGMYRIDSLVAGTYNLTVDRIGYTLANRTVGMTTYSKDTIDIVMNSFNSVHKEGISILKEYWLWNNYPNPFNPTTKIKYDIPLSRGVPEGRGVLVSLIVYDILGREVATLVNDKLSPGSYSVTWDATNYPSGIYFYKLESNDFTMTKKMVVLK